MWGNRNTGHARANRTTSVNLFFFFCSCLLFLPLHVLCVYRDHFFVAPVFLRDVACAVLCGMFDCLCHAGEERSLRDAWDLLQSLCGPFFWCKNGNANATMKHTDESNATFFYFSFLLFSFLSHHTVSCHLPRTSPCLSSPHLFSGARSLPLCIGCALIFVL